MHEQHKYKEVLSKKQIELLGLVKKFSDEFGLVGGTAIAIQLGKRRSVDFDLFTTSDFDSDHIRKIIREEFEIQSVLVEIPGELTVIVNGVKLTFCKYPFKITFTEEFEDVIKMPDLLTLAAMKAFALGRRSKWKDYVDLHFMFKECQFLRVVKRAGELFGGEFNEKLFREQLSYFNDMDFSEEVDYLEGFEISDESIKEKLKEISLQKY